MGASKCPSSCGVALMKEREEEEDRKGHRPARGGGTDGRSQYLLTGIELAYRGGKGGIGVPGTLTDTGGLRSTPPIPRFLALGHKGSAFAN